MENDLYFMQQAYSLALEAESVGEVPVGAVITINNEIIGSGYNQPIKSLDPSAHAEIVALRNAAQKIANYRLVDATIYVTLEPCPMCAYALLHARIKRLVYACGDLKTGACGGCIDLFTLSQWNHQIEVNQGPMSEECSALLKNFFQRKRKHSSMSATQNTHQ